MARMCVGGRGGNGFTQLPPLWRRNFLLSWTGDQAPLLCLRPLSPPHLYLSTSKLSACQAATPSRVLSRMGLFQNPTLRRPLQLGPVPTLLGRVSLSKGRCLAGPRKRSCDCAAGEVQTTANHNTRPPRVSPHSGILLPIPANESALQGPLGPLPMGRPYGLYQMHSKRGNRFTPCRPWTPQTPLPAPGHSPRFPTRAPSGTELRNFRLYFTVCTSLVVLKPTPFSPSVVLGNGFLVESPASVFHSFSLLHSSYFQRSTFLALPMHPTLPLSFSLCPLSTKTAAYLPQLFSPPVHLSAPCTCKVLWLEFCRLFC